MKIPEEMKIDTNIAVVFKKPFVFNGDKYNAIMQQDDGTLYFFNTDYMHTSGTVKVAYKNVDGGLDNNGNR